MNKQLGKITEVKFGFGGYQEAMFGLSIEFKIGTSGGCMAFVGGWWSNATKPDANTQWTEADRTKAKVDLCDEIQKILVDAHVSSIDKLIDIPCEIWIEDGVVKGWRILTEVL